ncbi:uncharacterized protein [Dermacentor albipictus]|uniref:uncharacterized protein isoform X2 n=1 Tax=Dermacentor albipictus TaxID=60249 RepID=UPI0031FDE160
MANVDSRCTQSQDEGADAPALAESPRRASSSYTLRSFSTALDDYQECRSLSHLGILMPIYLIPLLFLGMKIGGSLYCLFLPLLLWAFNSLPKPGAALIHLVTVPLMGLMEAEQVARQYLTVDALVLALVFFLVVIVDRWSELALCLANGICERFGLRRGKLFVVACLCSFACASLLSGIVVSTTLLYLLDRVLSVIFKENMDRPPELLRRGSQLGSQHDSSSVRSMIPSDQVLFDRLSQVVLTMEKPENTKSGFARKQRGTGGNGDKTGTTSRPQTGHGSSAAPATDDAPQVQEKTGPRRRFSLWRQLWSNRPSIDSQEPMHVLTKVPGTFSEIQPTGEHTIADGSVKPAGTTTSKFGSSSAKHDSAASFVQASQAPCDPGLVRIDVADGRGSTNPTTPSTTVKQSGPLGHPKDPRPDPSQRHASSVPISECEEVKQNASVSQAESSSKRGQQRMRRRGTFSFLFRRSGSPIRGSSKGEEGGTPSPNSISSRLFRNLGLIASKLIIRRISVVQQKQGDEDAGLADRILDPGSPSSRTKTSLNPAPVIRSMQKYPDVSQNCLATTTTEHTGSTSNYTAIVATTDARDTNLAHLPSNTPVANTSSNLGVHNASVPYESDSVRRTKLFDQELSSHCHTPEHRKKLSSAGLPKAKYDVGMRPVNKLDQMVDQPHEKPTYEKASRECRDESDTVATVITANTQEDAAKRRKSKTRGDKSVKKSESRERSHMDNSIVRKKRKRSRKESKDSAASPSRCYNLRPTSTACKPPQRPQGVIVPWCEEQPEKKGSGGDRATNEVRSSGIQTLETMLTAKDHQIDVNGLHCPPCAAAVETMQQLDDGRSNDARLTIPDADDVNKEPPTQTDSGKTENAVTSHTKSKRESFSRSKSRDEKRRSKLAVGSHHGSNVPAAKDHAKKTRKLASIDGTHKEKQDGKRRSQEHTRIKLAKTESGQVLQQPKAAETHVNGTAHENRNALEAHKSTGPKKQATAKDISSIQDSPSAQSRLPSSHQPHPAPSTNGLPIGSAGNKSVASTQPARRKQSVVSFGADVKELMLEAERPQCLPEPPALAHLKEMDPTGSWQRRRSTMPRTSSSMAVLRRASSADIGDTRYVPNGPVDIHPSVAHSRLQTTCSRSSRRSTGSMATILDTDAREQSRQTFTLQRTSRLRSFGAEETLSRSADYRASMFGSQLATQYMTAVRKKKVRSVRTDVHNAFLLGPSLMTVLGNICSFHEGGNKGALRVACHVVEETSQPPVNTFVWAIVTLPGAVLALVTCTTVIWLLYVRPHEPPSLSPENVAVIRSAQERSAIRGKPKGVELACATYLAIITLSYAPSLVLGLEQRMAVVGALASMMLVTNVLTSCIRAAFEFLRHVWETLPWGILILLGATQAASRLLQTHGIPIEMFKSVSVAAWEECSVLEVQAVLAFVASVLAETADKQVIVDIMAPMVQTIAELKQMYPAYYAIPVIVGASSNFIMPASLPLAILHELSRVSFWKLFLLGMFAKIVVMSMVIVAVNVVERAGFLGGQTPAQ